MEWDKQRETEKRSELLYALTVELKKSGIQDQDAKALSASVFEKYISTRPPEAKRQLMEFIVIGSMGSGGGKSTKAGNIKLNIGKLLEAVASGILTATGAAQLPVTVPLAALVIWCSLWRTAQVDISESDASVLYTMWVHKNADRDVLEEGLLEKCNSLLTKYERPSLSKASLRSSLKNLEKIEAIAASPRGTAIWWLREWVQVSYR